MRDLVPLLTDGRPPRTWSVLVTIFGDMALADDARLSGPFLSSLTEGMGIRPEALRTAIHRLRKEGWIESVRDGRTTSHALTPMGRAQTRAARPRIYATEGPRDLHLVVVEPGQPMPDGAVAVAPVLGLASRPVAWSVPVDRVPDWMRARICPPALMALTDDVADRFAALLRALDADPAQAAVLRVLVVHDWRRVVLRMPDLPDAAFPADWRGAEARRMAMTLLDRLPRPEEVEG